jgi:hypothetical protein
MEKVNWLGVFNIVAYAFIFAFIGMSLAPTIAYLNNGDIIYGTWSSYFVVIILYFLFMKDTNLVKTVEKKKEVKTK